MIELVKRLMYCPKTARKFIVALLGAVAVAISIGLLPADYAPWLAVASAFATSLGVYFVPNKSDGPVVIEDNGITRH